MTISKQSNCDIFFSGDICVSSSINQDFISKPLEEKIKSHDFRIANWEAPIIEKEDIPTLKAGPSIFQDESYHHILDKEIFNIYSLANNHIMDYGQDAFEKTMHILNQKNLTTGANITYQAAYTPLIIEKNNLKIAIVACGEYQFGGLKSRENSKGYAWIFSSELRKSVRDLKGKVDFIVLLPHAGLEMVELPLPEWRECYKELIDLGADLIVASHPHVIQPRELYNGKYIYYSLGNFLFNVESQKNNFMWNSSLNISCNFIINEEEKKIEIEEYFVEWKEEKLVFNNKPQNRFEELNLSIQNEGDYLKQINQACIKAWEEYYESYYLYGSQGILYTDDFYKKNRFIRSLVDRNNKKHLKRIGRNSIMLYHNIAIETHRFVVERAIKQMTDLE